MLIFIIESLICNENAFYNQKVCSRSGFPCKTNARTLVRLRHCKTLLLSSSVQSPWSPIPKIIFTYNLEAAVCFYHICIYVCAIRCVCSSFLPILVLNTLEIRNLTCQRKKLRKLVLCNCLVGYCLLKSFVSKGAFISFIF